MRKLQISILGLALLTSIVCFGKYYSIKSEKPAKASRIENLNLSNDKDFCDLFNSMLSFSYSIHKAKANNLLTKYGNKQASEAETNYLLRTIGFKSEADMKAFFLRMVELNKSLSKKYGLDNSQYSKNLIKQSILSLIKKEKSNSASMFEPDCELNLANAIAQCYAAQLICEQGYSEEWCLLQWTNCIASAWLAFDTCLP